MYRPRDQWLSDFINDVESFIQLHRRTIIIVGVVGLVLCAMGGYLLTQQRRTRRTEDSRAVVLVEGGRVTKEFSQGFIAWRYTENVIGDVKRIEATVTWNAASGADGTPVIGMPVLLIRLDHANKQMVEIIRVHTDTRGNFKMDVPPDIETNFAAKVHLAQNIPPTVKRAIQSQQKPQAKDSL